MEVLNYLLGYENIKIYQNTDMFNFSLDSVLLPNFVTVKQNDKKILDIGTGNAVIPIILSTKTDASILGVEIQEEAYDLAVKSVKYNNLESKISLLNQDIKEYAANEKTETYDVITCNPPFFKVTDDSNINQSKYKTIARHEVTLNLEDVINISKKLLKNNGTLAMVHRPERLIEIIEVMKKNNIEPKKIQLVYPTENKEANILLIEGTKNGNPGLKILEPIYAHDKNGNYTNQIKKYFS